jgi:type III secretion protein J
MLSVAGLGLGCKQAINQGLTEDQANEILVVLDQNGIHGDKVPEVGGEVVKFSIHVNQRDAAHAWQILRENDLPKPAKRGFSDVFGKTSLIPTAMEEKALFLEAICGELAKTIEAINGVVDARVHVVLPDSDILKTELQGPTLPKAAVLIKYKVDRNGNAPFRAEDIRQLVANSVEGLKPADVTVVSSQVFGDRPPDMIFVGPLKISKDSRNPLIALVGVMVLIVVVLGVIMMMMAKSSLSLKKEVGRLRAAAAASRGQLAKTAEK